MKHAQDENVAGNYYNKYESKNPIARRLVEGFLGSFDTLTNSTKSLKIFEIGCGEGVLSKRLHDAGNIVLGTDLDPDVIALAQKQYAKEGDKLTFQNQSIYDLKAGALADYDLVVCCEVFEHLPDPQKALEILAQSGAKELVLSVPREPLWRVMNMARLRYLKDLGNTPGHLNHWSRRGFLKFISQKFTIIETRPPIPWTFVRIKPKDA